MSTKPEELTAPFTEYTAQLRAQVPVEIAEFEASGLRADQYAPHEHHPNLFRSLTIKVEPVKLTDKLTGRTERYTRARLTLCHLDPPGPPRVGDLRSYHSRAIASAATPIEWANVEMLP